MVTLIFSTAWLIIIIPQQLNSFVSAFLYRFGTPGISFLNWFSTTSEITATYIVLWSHLYMMQGYVQDEVWAHQCYGNVGFVYKLMYKYKQYIVIHLNRLKQAHRHKVFNSTFQSVLLKCLRMCRCISVVDMIKWLMLFCISSLLIYAPSLGTQNSILASETLHMPLWWWNKSVSLSLLHWPYKRKHQHESSSPICQNILFDPL